MNQKRILILIHQKAKRRPDPNWEDFQAKLAPHLARATVTMGALTDLVFDISPQGLNIYDPERQFKLADFDLVVFRIIRQNWARVSTCCSLLQSLKIPYVDQQYQPRPISKYASEAMRLLAGLPVIHTVFARHDQLIDLFRNNPPFDWPCIVKDANGRKGRVNFLVKSLAEMQQVLGQHAGVNFIAQQFIPNDGDYRCLVMGNQLKLVIHRQAHVDSHLNNTSRGAHAQLMELGQIPQAWTTDILQAAALENLQVAGVDLIVDKRTGQPYILEVNSSPQLTTGAYPELKTQAYANYLSSLL